MNSIAPKYWTLAELRELEQAVNLSLYGAKPLWWNGRYGRFLTMPTVTFVAKDIAHPDVTNPALILHGILEDNPEFRNNKEFDLDQIGRAVQYFEEPPV